MAEPQLSRFERRLGQVLVEGGFLTEEQLEESHQAIASQEGRLTSVLQERGWISRDTLTTVLSFHLKVPVADPRQVEIDAEAVKLVPESVALESNVMPLSIDRDGTLRVLMDDPGDFETINRLAGMTSRQIKPVLPIGDGLDELVRRNYTAGAQLATAIDIAVEAGQRGGVITRARSRATMTSVTLVMRMGAR